MKINRLLICACLIGSGLAMQSCWGMFGNGADPNPLAVQIQGRWEWLRTVANNRTRDSASSAKTRQTVLRNDQTANGDVVEVYLNGQLVRKMVDLNQPGTIIQNKKAQTVLIRYRDSTGTLYWQKYYFLTGNNRLSPGKDVLATSEFMKEYSEAADTVQYVYERTH